jgi:hypothetical protein
MNKISKILETLTQYRDQGDVKVPTTRTQATLGPGIYKIAVNPMTGEAVFTNHNLVTDELLKFEDSRHQLVLSEVHKFWGLREKLKFLGFTHKRGILLHGKPGSGKSCLLKLVMNDIVEKGDVVMLAKSPNAVVTCLDQFRKVEPTRRVVVILEDIDEMVRYDEHSLLELFDGDSQVDGVLYLGTTNYLDRLPPRMKRAGRFDRTIEIPFPPREGRIAYLQKKIGLHEKEDPQVIEDIADATDGLSFGQLREFLISVYVYGYDPSETISRLTDPRLTESTAPSVELAKSFAVDPNPDDLAPMTEIQKASVKAFADRVRKKKYL